jgi:hypothetical protein
MFQHRIKIKLTIKLASWSTCLKCSQLLQMILILRFLINVQINTV